MNVNSAAEGALETYLGMKNPGYAVLIDSPWGAGKTHFAQRVCKDFLSNEKIRYVSLNGVSSQEAFRRALLRESLESSLIEKGSWFAKSLFRKVGIEEFGSFAEQLIEERLISNLPDTLIFDDLERAPIDPQVLFGLINDFIEHKQKQVILLVHSDAIDDEFDNKKTKFLARKEKLVGRTISIEPDFDAAFPGFVSAIQSGSGEKFLREHSGMVKDVFDQSGHKNLRILRNSIRDCATILDRIDEQLFSAKEPVSRFVRTYLALSMALAKGELNKKDLAKRGNYKIAITGEIEDNLKPLRQIVLRHDGADVYGHSGSALPMVLDEWLFEKGHVETTFLNECLKATGQFQIQDENPLWKQLVHWGDSGLDEIADLVEKGTSYLLETETVEAGPYLQIADSILRVEENGGLEVSREELTDDILDRIRYLGENDGIPVAKLGTEFGWGICGRQFSFGGYGCETNDEFQEIVEAMREEQFKKYESGILDVAEEFLSCFENDLGKFYSEICFVNEVTNFNRVRILHHLDIGRFSAATLKYLQQGEKSQLGIVFEKLAERHNNAQNWEDEREWLVEFRKKLEDRVAVQSKLARAQLDMFFRYHWKFVKPESTAEENTVV